MDLSDLTKSETELIKKLCFSIKSTIGKTIGDDDAYELLSENDWDLKKAMYYYKHGKKAKTIEKKEFKIGDIIKCVDSDPGKLPKDCYEFIMTYKKFKVLDVNGKLNIDLGHRLVENGNPYYFSPNRFELLNGIAPKKIVGGSEEMPKEEMPKPSSSPVLPSIEWKEVTKSKKGGSTWGYDDSSTWDDPWK